MVGCRFSSSSLLQCLVQIVQIVHDSLGPKDIGRNAMYSAK